MVRGAVIKSDTGFVAAVVGAGRPRIRQGWGRSRGLDPKVGGTGSVELDPILSIDNEDDVVGSSEVGKVRAAGEGRGSNSRARPRRIHPLEPPIGTDKQVDRKS